MLMPISNFLYVIDSICAATVTIYLLKDLTTTSKILCLTIVAAMLGIPQICLCTNKIKENLMVKHKEIVAAAISSASNEDWTIRKSTIPSVQC